MTDRQMTKKWMGLANGNHRNGPEFVPLHGDGTSIHIGDVPKTRRVGDAYDDLEEDEADASRSNFPPRGNRKISTTTFAVASYASPLVQAISAIMTFLFLHCVVTMVMLLSTLSSDVVLERTFFAEKSCHIFIPFLGAYYGAIAYQKSTLEYTNKADFLNGRLLFLFLATFALLVTDCVFFGKDTVPTIRSCYEDPIPPIFCDTDGKKIAYSASVGLRSAHIVLEALIILTAFAVRYSRDGDSLFQTVEVDCDPRAGKPPVKER